MKKWFLATVCAVAGFSYWLLRPAFTPPVSQPEQLAQEIAHVPAPADSNGSGRTIPDPSPALSPQLLSPSEGGSSGVTASASASARIIAAPAPPSNPDSSTEAALSLPPATLLENMRTTLRQYGLMFGGNPVGTNPEITKSLDGENPKQIRFLGPDGNRINQKGELVDAWGTPYFFHQLSAMEMEIRSAGPDRIMWTADDLVIK